MIGEAIARNRRVYARIFGEEAEAESVALPEAESGWGVEFPGRVESFGPWREEGYPAAAYPALEEGGNTWEDEDAGEQLLERLERDARLYAQNFGEE